MMPIFSHCHSEKQAISVLKSVKPSEWTEEYTDFVEERLFDLKYDLREATDELAELKENEVEIRKEISEKQTEISRLKNHINEYQRLSDSIKRTNKNR